MTEYNNILITGASSGIGFALAKKFAKKNITLFLSGRNQQRLDKIATLCLELGAKVYTKSVDVCNKEEMYQWIRECNEQKPLDLVIANAGISAGTSNSGESDEQVRRIFDINVNGVFNTINPAIALMKENKSGHIVIISSLAGFRGLPSCPAYSTSKAAVKAYGQALYGDLLPYNINVTVVCPGYIKTPLTEVNNFPMPFLMEANKAADIIIKGIYTKKSLVAFPFIMFFSVWLFSILPCFISDFIAARLPKK